MNTDTRLIIYHALLVFADYFYKTFQALTNDKNDDIREKHIWHTILENIDIFS